MVIDNEAPVPVVMITSISQSSNLRESVERYSPDIKNGRGMSMDSDIEIITPRRRHRSSSPSSSDTDEEPKK